MASKDEQCDRCGRLWYQVWEHNGQDLCSYCLAELTLTEDTEDT